MAHLRNELLGALFLGLLLATGRAEEASRRFAAMFEDAAVFERALAARPTTPPPGHRVTGITVPHHLAAADLIALGFRCASMGKYERIILLSPDHFKRSRLPFAPTRGVV